MQTKSKRRFVMSENLKPIQRLDLEKLKGRITKVISTEEALKGVEPMEWPKIGDIILKLSPF